MDLIMNCEITLPTHAIWAYFKNTCGDYQKGWYGTWSESESALLITVYGDSNPNDALQDGYQEGDELVLKLFRNGIDYMLRTYASPTYSSSTGSLTVWSMVTGITPIIEVTGNNYLINPGTTTTSSTNNTNFGVCDTLTTHTFEIANVGCDVMTVNSITISDMVNFSLGSVSSTIASDGYDDLEITYNAIENATATVSIYNNSLTSPYTFTVTGSVPEILSTCGDISISPNPVASWGAIVVIPISQPCTLSVAIYNTNGVLITNVYGPIAVSAGSIGLAINPTLLSNNTPYILRVQRGSQACGVNFTVNK